MAHLPLLFSESSHLLLTFFLLIWTPRWFCVHFCFCLNSCCSGGNTDVRTGWSEKHNGNVCHRVWLTLMDWVSSDTLASFSHEALSHFSSSERPSEVLTWVFFFCVCSHLYFYRNWFLIFFISDFVPWGLCWHMWAKGAQPILSKVFFSFFLTPSCMRIWQPHSVWIIFQMAIVFSLGVDSLMIVLIIET